MARRRGRVKPQPIRPLAIRSASSRISSNWMRVKDYSEYTIRNRQLYIALLLAVVRRARPRGPDGSHPARAGTLPAASVPPSQERRAAAQLPHAVRAPRAVAHLVPLDDAENHILHNPASDLELPRLESSSAPHVLTATRSRAGDDAARLADPLGLRDRAILEMFYSTGIRRMELIRLKLFDLDTERGTLLVRQGKGKKDRFVPIGERAAAWVEKYIREARPQLAMRAGRRHAVPGHRGRSVQSATI